MRPAIDEESLGIRLHEVNKQRAVDRAIERLRYGLRADWHYLSPEDHANLRWVIGELWATTGRDAWEAFHFSKLDFDATRSLVMAGGRMRGRHTNGMSSLEQVAALVSAASGRYDHERVPSFMRASAG